MLKYREQLGRPTPFAGASVPPEFFRRARRKPAAGFTIIELVVVIGIMVIMVGIMMPAIKSLTRSNNQKQAVNLLTALIANAHALALQSHTPAGLVIYEDPSLPGQSSAQLVVQSGTSSTPGTVTKYFEAAQGAGPQQLPKAIKVATLNADSSSLFNTGDSSTTTCRIILFDGNGQLVLQSNLLADPSVTTTPAITAWNLSGGGVGASTPGVLVYDANELQNAKDNGIVDTSATKVGAWLQQNADALIVNAYTGNVIR